MNISNYISFGSLVVSCIALRKTIKWSKRFKELSMDDAYKKINELSCCLRCIENCLNQLSGASIGGFDITNDLKYRDRYKGDDRMRKRIRRSLKNAQEIGESLNFMLFNVCSLRNDFRRLGYFTSCRNEKRLDFVVDQVMQINGIIESYSKNSFDYFDDEELCHGMRYSKHCFGPEDDVSSKLAGMVVKFRDDIVFRSGQTMKELKKINYKEDIGKLYKIKS